MTSEIQSMDQLVDNAEHIGVVGSPSSTGGMSLDILGTAVSKKLVGELALFRYLQDTQQHYALGQITEVSLRNIWHEDPTMRSLIRQRGRVDAVSERQDTHQGEMTISAVFADNAGNYRPSILGTVPATGTTIHLVEDVLLDELVIYDRLLSGTEIQSLYLSKNYTVNFSNQGAVSAGSYDWNVKAETYAVIPSNVYYDYNWSFSFEGVGVFDEVVLFFDNEDVKFISAVYLLFMLFLLIPIFYYWFFHYRGL